MFEAVYENVKIDYFPSYPDQIIARLQAAQIDIAVLPKVDYLNAPGLVFHDAFKEPMVLMMNKNHALATKKVLRFKDFKNENFIVLKGDFGRALFEQLSYFLNQFGYDPPKKIAEKDTVEAAALSMKPDGGVMMLPGHFIESRISGNVKCINILDEYGYIRVSLVRNRVTERPVIDQFIRFYLTQVRLNQNPVIDQHLSQYFKQKGGNLENRSE
jgi:DNA-binding transcriptional LysR family regulator